MKADELRIGNIIRIGENIYKIRAEGFLPTSYSTSVAEPVMLTEDWILKLGAKQSQNRKDIFNMSGYVLVANLEEKYNIYKDGGYLTTLEFVHQWQNLYFALTGHELQYTQAGWV